jgi:hypothetical protein
MCELSGLCNDGGKCQCFLNNINLLIGCTALNCVKELGKHCRVDETWNYGCRLWCFEGYHDVQHGIVCMVTQFNTEEY